MKNKIKTKNKSKKDLVKEFGWVEVQLHNYCTHFHIKEVKETYVLLEDNCPKRKDFGNGDTLKMNIDLEDPDEVNFRENCKKIVGWSKRRNKCPEVNINVDIGVRLMELC